MYNIVADIQTARSHSVSSLQYPVASENLVTVVFYVPPKLILKEPLERSFEEFALGILWIIMSLLEAS